MRSYTQNPDPPAGVLDDRQHVQACPGPGDDPGEVTGNQGSRLRAEKTGGSDLDAEDEERQPRSFVAWTALGAGAVVSSAASSGLTRAACWSQAT